MTKYFRMMTKPIESPGRMADSMANTHRRSRRPGIAHHSHPEQGLTNSNQLNQANGGVDDTTRSLSSLQISDLDVTNSRGLKTSSRNDMMDGSMDKMMDEMMPGMTDAVMETEEQHEISKTCGFLAPVEEQNEEDTPTAQRSLHVKADPSSDQRSRYMYKPPLAREERTTSESFHARLERQERADIRKIAMQNPTEPKNLLIGLVPGAIAGTEERSREYYAPIIAQGRTPDAYEIFFNEERERMFARLGGVLHGDFTMIFPQRWEEMSEFQQAKYFKEAARVADELKKD